MQTTRRLECLDLLRGLAILLVLGRHFRLPAVGTSLPFLGAFAAAWQRVGWVGVDLFFVLSGFLVSGLLFSELIRTGKVSAGRFLLRRGFKIYPGYYALLSVYLFERLTEAPLAMSFRTIAAYGIFIQNYTELWVNHTWSLAIEEHFYFALAGLFFVAAALAKRFKSLRPDPVKLVGGFWLALAAACLFFRLRAEHHSTWFNWFKQMSLTHLRADALFTGVFLATIYHYHGAKLLKFCGRFRWLLLAGAGACLLPALLLEIETHPFVHIYGLALNSLGFGMLLLATLAVPEGAFGSLGKWVAGVGRDSYSIYLWHIIAFHAVDRVSVALGFTNWIILQNSIQVCVSIAFGMVMARIIERPFLAIREKLVPPRSSKSLKLKVAA